MTFTHKLTLGALVASTALNGFLVLTLKNTAKATQTILKTANQRALDAEKREQARVDHLLQMIDTTERIELRSVPVEETKLPPLSPTKPWISDFPYDDETWDDMHQPPDGDV